MSATTSQPRRLDAYIRVSRVKGREGETFISPGQQDERIRAWAQAMGHEISDAGPDNGAWHELDVSGGKMDRPYLNEIMTRIDAGESDGIVVFTLDRFGRTLVGALQLIERISAKGALFASVSDGFDITTDNGRLILRIMLSLAQFELERSRTRWMDARSEAIDRGWHFSGRRPFGYRREGLIAPSGQPYRGRLVVDPVEGPVVTELFRRRAAGESNGSLRDWLQSTGVPTSSGRERWHVGTLQKIFANKVYLGDAYNGVYVKHDAHPALTDPVTYRAVQAPTAPVRARKGAVHPALAQGIVRCAGCRYVAAVQRDPRSRDYDHDVWSYVCIRNREAHDCPAPFAARSRAANNAPTVDDVIAERVLAKLVEPIAYLGLDDVGDDDFDALEQAWVTANERHADAVADIESEQKHGSAAWERRCMVLKAIAEEAEELLTQARRRVDIDSLLGRPVRELARDWHDGKLDLEQKRLIVTSTVQAIFVQRATGNGVGGGTYTEQRRERALQKLGSRLHIVWVGEPAVDVPRQGRRDWYPQPFEFPAAQTNPHDARMLSL